MKRYELVQMVDPVRFQTLLARAKISDDEKGAIIRDRSKWLWETYKPSDEDMQHTKDRINKKESW